VLGEVYLIPTHEYDDKPMLHNEVQFKGLGKIENYIDMFQQINDRAAENHDVHKYERICLLVADFRKVTPKLYSSTKSLFDDNIIPKSSKSKMEGLSIETFAEDILSIYSKRFDLSSTPFLNKL